VLLVASCAVIHSSVAVPIAEQGEVAKQAAEQNNKIRIIYGNQSIDVPLDDIVWTGVSETRRIAEDILGVEIRKLCFDNDVMIDYNSLYQHGVHKYKHPVLFAARLRGEIGQTMTKSVDYLNIVQGETVYELTMEHGEQTTIGQLKNILAEKTGWDAKEIVIEFDGLNLNVDSETLRNAGINRRMYPALFISRLQPIHDINGGNNKDEFVITVQNGEKSYAMKTELDIMVKQFRELVEQNTGLSNIELTFKGEELLDDMPLNAYGLDPDSDHVVFLSKNIE